MKTQTIAGHKITLETGKNYIATRPMAQRGMKTFPVSIRPSTGHLDGRAVTTVNGLDYDQANELLNAFNNGEISFDGRIW